MLLLGAVTYAGMAQGAFHASQLRLLTLLLLAAAVTSLWSKPLTADDLRVPPVAACVAVAASSLLSALVEGRAAGAVMPAELLGCLVAVLLVVRRLDEPDRELLVAGAVGVAVLVAATGWFGAVARHRPLGLVDGGLWRSASTITYANGTAAVMAMASLVALARSVTTPTLWWRLGAYSTMVTLGTTLSRAGLVSFAAGLAVLVVLLGWRPVTARIWPVVVGSTLGVLAALPGLAADRQARPLLAAIGLLAGAGVALAGDRFRPPAVLKVMAVVAAAAMVLAFLIAPSRLTAGPLGGRASLSSPDRHREWDAAVRLARRRPLTGVGPTNAVFSWRAPDGTVRAVAYAHNELLQVLATTGILGLLVLLAGFTSTVFWVHRRFGSSPRWVGACTVSAGAAAAVHGLMDFVWHIPMIPVLGAMLLALMTPCTSNTLTGRWDRRER